jgi:sulfite exporter TauE/SafE
MSFAAAELPSALLLGLLGSLHCVAMCGPLAWALPLRAGAGRVRRAAARLEHQLGRATTYAALGFGAGAVGQGLRLAGLQRALSLGAAAVVLAHLARRLGWLPGRLAHAGPAAVAERWGLRLHGVLAPRLRVPGSPWWFGMLNGLLPCGLVGIALATAAATGSAWRGAATMAVFGLGTLPLMWLAAVAGGALAARLGGRLQRWAPLALAVLALLLLARGLRAPAAPGAGDLRVAVAAVPCHGT